MVDDSENTLKAFVDILSREEHQGYISWVLEMQLRRQCCFPLAERNGTASLKQMIVNCPSVSKAMRGLAC